MRSINDITPQEWDRMGRPRKERESILQGEYDEHEAKRVAEIKNSLYGEQILNNPSLKAGVYAQMDARDAYLAKETSDGSTANYYVLPKNAAELQDLISAKNMNAQIGEIFRACYRYGQVAHSPEIRDIKKILYYANAELKRLGG
jgi:hypothetical protein